SLFIIGHMGLFFYTQKGSIISTVDLPTTEIIEPFKFEGDYLHEVIRFHSFKYLTSCSSLSAKSCSKKICKKSAFCPLK
ncbi:hypothetical protein F6P82_10130, partial [Streptococcus suis]|nr:hypothetical protein [Streptococcus suis]